MNARERFDDVSDDVVVDSRVGNAFSVNEDFCGYREIR